MIPATMLKRPPPAAPVVKLVCLGGRALTAELLLDLRKACSLPEAAKAHFWELLGPCLQDHHPRDLAARVARFCSAHGASAADLGDAIGAARCLIRGASALDLSTEAFAQDLAHVPGDHDLGALLVPGYEAAKAAVRAEMVRESVADLGKMLAGVDYRVDVALSSSRAEKLGMPVALLALRYKRGNRRGRVTLQASLDGVRELRDTCNRILQDASRAALAPVEER